MLDPMLVRIRPTNRCYLPILHPLLALRRPIRLSHHCRHRCYTDSVYEPERSMQVFVLHPAYTDWVSVMTRSTLGFSLHLQHMDWGWPTTRSMPVSVRPHLNMDWESDLVHPNREYDHQRRGSVLIVHW